MEISFTDAMFYEDIYAISGTGSTSTGTDVGVKGGGQYPVVTGPKVEIPFQINTANVQVRGLTLADSVTTGKFTATYNDVTKVTTLTFNDGDVTVGDTIVVTYERRVAQASVTTVTTVGGTARGSLTLTWAVMSAGDDCSVASVIGYYHLKVPRVMVTTRASLDTSRGSAATPNIVFSAIDAHRADNQWYELVYEELDDGIPSTDYTGAIIWDDNTTGATATAKLSSLAFGAATLTPTFNASVYAYTATLSAASDTITVAAADSATAHITVNGTEVTSGASASFNTGNNTVNITVSKAGMLSTTYLVTVVRS